MTSPKPGSLGQLATVKNDRIRTCLVQNEDLATERVDPGIFSWSIRFMDRF